MDYDWTIKTSISRTSMSLSTLFVLEALLSNGAKHRSFTLAATLADQDSELRRFWFGNKPSYLDTQDNNYIAPENRPSQREISSSINFQGLC